MAGSHGICEKNVFNEESPHLPLMIRFQDQINNSTNIEGHLSTIDLFATILDYLSVGEASSDGKSLRGIIDAQDEEQDSLVVTEWL